MFRAQRFRLTSALCVVIVGAIHSATGVPGPEYGEVISPVAQCSSTGPTCINKAECAQLPDGDYQWCGGCDVMVRCFEQKPAFFRTYKPLYTAWDDNKKDFVAAGASTTCSECYFECPADRRVAPGADGLCHKTGPTCVEGTQFCHGLSATHQNASVQPQTLMKKFQYCGSCGYYVNCVLYDVTLSEVIRCPGSTRFDWILDECVHDSATCRDCYEPCAPAAKCSSTGPTCIHETDCALLPDGVYQWCGGCDLMVRCLEQKPALFPTVQPLYTAWDDNKRSFVEAGASTTCSECYFECPSNRKVAPSTAGLCDKTGPTCVDGLQFCNGLASSRRFQYCGGCSSYVNCVIFDHSPSALVDCPPGSFFDQNLEECIAASRTCRECYEPCKETSSVTTSTATTKMTSSTTTTKMASSTTTNKTTSSTTPTPVASSTTSSPHSTTPGEADGPVAKGEWRINGAEMAAILIGALIAALGGVLVGIVIGRRFVTRVIPALSPQRHYKVDSSSSSTEEKKHYDDNELPAKA